MMDPLHRQKWEGDRDVPELEPVGGESWLICGSAPEAINVELISKEQILWTRYGRMDEYPEDWLLCESRAAALRQI